MLVTSEICYRLRIGFLYPMTFAELEYQCPCSNLRLGDDPPGTQKSVRT